MSHSLSEQEIIRREKLQALEAAGINPYPAPFILLPIIRKILRTTTQKRLKSSLRLFVWQVEL
jgi:hypothetical protein